MFKLKLHPGEKALEMIRQTEMVLAKPCFIILLAIYIPWFFIFKYEVVGEYYKWVIAWSIFWLLYGIYKYILWLLNVNIITNQRVVSFVYKGLTHKQVSEAPLDRITNITFTTKGLLASLFNFGTLEIHLAHIPEPLRLPKMRKPEEIKDLLWDLREKHGQQG
jgi:uncharacterized membrane protein YdbT with pleckstrin-like domain